MRSSIVLFLALSLSAQHADKSGEKKPNPAIGDPRAIAAGKALFASSCAACHGPTGEGGRGPNLHQRGAWHPLDEEGLYVTIRDGIGGADMPPTKLPEEQLWQIAAFVRSLTAPAIETAPGGDVAAGEAIFWSKGDCGSCHRIRGRGGLLGPDLSNIGASRSVERLRQAIIDPDADGVRGYQGVIATLKNGTAVRGVARNRTNYSVQILDEKGRVHLLDTADLRGLEFSSRSPMPGDYNQRLSRQELMDLLAFLSRQSVRPYEPKKSGEKN